MNSEEARRGLVAGDPDEKREAARWLARHATDDDRAFVVDALADQPDHWVLSALREAIGRLEQQPSTDIPLEDATDVDTQLAVADAYARGLRDTTRMLVHELRRFVGFAKLSAGDLSPAYPGSELQEDLDRLASLLDAIERLGTAAGTPEVAEFDLGELLVDIVSREEAEYGLRAQTRGPQPMMVRTDRRLIELAARAAIRNAFEAVQALGPQPELPLVVTWDTTDRDAWFSVIDQGPGPSKAIIDPFEFAATTKDENAHLGVGLALARRVAQTLGGTVSLSDAPRHGAVFEFRWPLTR